MKKFLGEEGIRFFRHLKGLKDEVFPVLKLNQRKKGIPIHPIHLREGVQIRNWMRQSFEEFREMEQGKIEDLAGSLIEKAIL